MTLARGLGEFDGDVGGLRDGEFFDFHGHATGMEFTEHKIGEVGGEFLDELPFAAVAEFQQALDYREVVNSLVQLVGSGGGGKIEIHVHGEQQALGLGTFLIGYAHAIEDFEVNDGNLGHLRFTIYDLGVWDARG